MSAVRGWRGQAVPVLVAWLVVWCAGCPGDDDDTDVPDDDVADDDSAEDDEPIADVAWRLHDEIESLVYVTWTQADPATTHVEFSFDEGEWLSSPAEENDAGESEALLLGIPYDTEFTFRLVYELGDGPVTTDEQSAETGALPGDFPVPALLESDDAAYEPTGRYLMSSINAYNGGWTGGDYYKFIMDRRARIVWTLLTPDNSWSIYLRVAQNGEDILWDDSPTGRAGTTAQTPRSIG